MLTIPSKKMTYGKDSTTKLLIHGDGANNGTALHDCSGKSVTVGGNVVTKTAVKKYGVSSIYFPGGAATDQVSLADNDDWDIANDYTVSLWVYLVENRSYNTFIGNTNNAANQAGWAFGIFGNSLQFFATSGNGVEGLANITVAHTPATATWTHYCFMRSGTTGYTYVNGVQKKSDNCSAITSPGALIMGRLVDQNTSILYGYVDEVVIAKGKLLYPVAGFTPPLAAYY